MTNALIADEALQLVANNIQLVQKVVDTSSDLCLAWSDSLVLMQNIFKTGNEEQIQTEISS
jgi:hypothetical protein